MTAKRRGQMQKDSVSMKKLMMTLALGAAVISTPVIAQQGGERGGFMRDQTRAEAQQRADMMF